VLGNDSDADGDPLTALKASDPLHGSVALNAYGSFDYTPDAGFAGTDSFTYQANDGALKSAPVTVSIFVQEVAPFGTADSYTLLHDRVLHVAGPGVLGNDGDSDGDALTAVKASIRCTAALFPCRRVVRLAPVAGFIGSDSFSYRADDGRPPAPGHRCDVCPGSCARLD
jgi:hypothetical protein